MYPCLCPPLTVCCASPPWGTPSQEVLPLPSTRTPHRSERVPDQPSKPPTRPLPSLSASSPSAETRRRDSDCSCPAHEETPHRGTRLTLRWEGWSYPCRPTACQPG